MSFVNYNVCSKTRKKKIVIVIIVPEIASWYGL